MEWVVTIGSWPMGTTYHTCKSSPSFRTKREGKLLTHLTDNLLPVHNRKSFYASIILYNIGLCVVKMSILLQYRRIFTYTLVQRLTAIGLIFEGCWTITLSLVLPLSCIPVAAFWDPSVSGRCIDSLTIWYVMAAINLVTDFLTFSMPLPVIKSLQLPNRQKIMLTGVFCLGFL